MKNKSNFYYILNPLVLLKKVKQRIFPYLPEENSETIRKRQNFYSSFVGRNDLVFDVGANIGNRIRPLINLGAKIVAIEPQVQCQRILQKKFNNSIIIVKEGLGAKEEVKDFFIADSHTISSFSTDWIESVKQGRFKNYNWNTTVKVKMTTLDILIEKFGVPKFIKIDVEGYELEVLKGLSHSIHLISFEYTVPEQIDKVIDCINQIEKHNSKIECNFSRGESMSLEFNKWLSSIEFKNFVSSSAFISTGFGDIYIRKI
jgi:FkbM family methyltransferase